jgi:hypothetical protein
MRVRLEKISSNHDQAEGIRYGDAVYMPEVGEPFYMTEPHPDGYPKHRVLSTSRIVSIEHIREGLMKFSTLNSVYELEVMNAMLELIRISEDAGLYEPELQRCKDGDGDCQLHGHLTRIGDGKSMVLCDDHYYNRFGRSRR